MSRQQGQVRRGAATLDERRSAELRWGRRVLSVLCPLGLLLNGPALVMAGHLAALVLAIALSAGLLLAVFAERDFDRQAAAANALLFALGITYVVTLGTGHAHPLWLVSAGVAAGITHGTRGALFGLGATALSLLASWVVGPWIDPLWLAERADPWRYAIFVTELAALQGALSLTAGYLLSRLERSIERERHQRAEVELQHAQLEIALDVLAREQAETGRLSERLERARRLEAVGQVTSSIAHDISNMLTPIVTYTQLALAEVDRDSPIRQDLDHVLGSARRIKDLTTQVLAFGREIGPTNENVHLDRLVREVARDATAMAPEGSNVRTELPGREVIVFGNDGALHRLIMNLVVNALQALRDGRGTVTLRVREMAEPPGEALDSPCACVEVQDDGVGMDLDTVQRIFEPHFTTKRMGSGTGLGLATVHGIVRALGGTVRVESAPGRGTVFRVYLPRA